jgi:hypothetical protein
MRVESSAMSGGKHKSSQDFESTPHSSGKREKSADVGGDRSRDIAVGKAETTQFTSSIGSENQAPSQKS